MSADSRPTVCRTKPTKPTKPTKEMSADADARFQEFWQAYPARSGKKLDKAVTHALFLKLSTQDQALAVTAARNYAEALNHQGISAKDPKRFLRDGQGHEPWRDWITPAHLTAATKPPRDPIPKAFQPAQVISASLAEPCPPDAAVALQKIIGMRGG